MHGLCIWPRASKLLGILVCVSGSHAPCARPNPARHAQRARAGAPVGSEGSSAAHGTTRRSIESKRMEQVRLRRVEGSYVGAMTHPVTHSTHSTLGARVVGTVGHRTVVLGSQGVVSD